MKIHNSKGFSHHLLLPVVAFLLVAGIGGYIMQRGSSAASKTGWTSLGTATLSNGKSTAVEEVYYGLNIKACKIATGQSNKFKVKINEQLQFADNPSDSLWLEIKDKSASNKKIGSVNLGNAKTYNASYYPKWYSFKSSTIAGNHMVYVKAYSKDAKIAKSSKVKHVSDLLTCK